MLWYWVFAIFFSIMGLLAVTTRSRDKTDDEKAVGGFFFLVGLFGFAMLLAKLVILIAK